LARTKRVRPDIVIQFNDSVRDGARRTSVGGETQARGPSFLDNMLAARTCLRGASQLQRRLASPQIQARVITIAAAIDASVCTLVDLMERIYISNFLHA